jgi:predicted RND superfamily exporter protein
MFSSILPLQLFGLATTSAILLAFLADILIAPALVTLATRNRQRQGVAPIR